MNKKAFILGLVALLGIILLISSVSAVWWNPFTWFDPTADTILKDNGITGMKIADFSVNGEKTTDLTYDKANYLLETEFKKVDKTVTQDIYYTNKRDVAEIVNFSTIVQIEYSQIRWNGTRYNLADKPIKLTSWYDKYGSLIVPNIFMDDKFNKRINYRDVAEKGGYALAYSSGGKYYIELKIDNLNIQAKEEYYVDPTYTNSTAGFSTLVATADNPNGVAFNGTNFLVSTITPAVFCFNLTGGYIGACSFSLSTGCTDPQGITTDKLDASKFYIVSQSQAGVCHLSSSGVNLSGGFGLEGITGQAIDITANTSTIFVNDDNDKTAHAWSLTGTPVGGIDFRPLGSDRTMGIATNGSIFAVANYGNRFVYFSDMKGNNLTEYPGFSLSDAQATPSAPRIEISPDGHWVYDADYTDCFIYAFWDGVTPFGPPTIDITSPTNNSNFSYSGIPINYTYSNESSATCSYSTNYGATNTSMTCGQNITGVNWGAGTTNLYLYITDTEGGASSAVTFSVVSGVTITSPANNSNFSYNNVPINYTYFSAGSPTCSYSINGGGANSTITCGNNITAVNWPEGVTNLYLYLEDISGIKSSAVTFRVDKTNPVVNITLPLNTTYITSFATNNSVVVNLDWTSHDEATLTSCYYSVDGGANNSVTCGQNQSVTLTYGGHRFNVYAYDEAGNLGQSSISGYWTYAILFNNITYSNPALGGTLQTIKYNFSSGFGVTSAVLNYLGNNTYGGITIDGGSNNIATANTVVPNIAANNTFFWNITLNNGLSYVSSNYNQTVIPISIDNCSSNSDVLYNFSMYDENTLLPIDGGIKYTVSIYNPTDSALLLNYSGIFNYSSAAPNASICMNNITSYNPNYFSSYTIQFQGNSSVYYPRYLTQELGSLVNLTFPTNIKLYSVLAAESSLFPINVQGGSVGTTGLLVTIQKLYIPTNTFYTVESAITNAQSLMVAHMNLNGIYNYIISHNGVNITASNNLNQIPVCTYAGDCTQYVQLGSTTTTLIPYNQLGNITGTWNITQSDIYLTFYTQDGRSHYVVMTIGRNGFNNQTFCNASATGTTGTLHCAIPVTYRSMPLQSFVWSDGFVWHSPTYFAMDKLPPQFYGVDIIITLLLYSCLVLLFLSNPQFIIVGTVLGMFLSGLLIIGMGGGSRNLISAILFFVIAGVIILVRVGQKRYQ